MYIDGNWVQSQSGRTVVSYNPATGKPLGEAPEGTRRDAQRAIKAANKNKHKIADLSIWERAQLCNRIADIISTRQEELAKILSEEQGKPYYTEALSEVESASSAFRNSAEQIKWLETSYIPMESKSKLAFTLLRPRGVYGVITPWNFPLGVPSIYYLAPGLAAGNAVVWVPAPSTSICAIKLVECLEEAGLPHGVVNLVTGYGPVVGDEVVAHPMIDAIGFTGSSSTGKIIATRGAGKPLSLELGGSAPCILLEDADIEKASRAIVKGCFTNAGQICTAIERVYVHQSIKKLTIECVLDETRRVRLGDPFNPETTMGPLHSEEGVSKVEKHLKDAIQLGARVIMGGKRADGFASTHYFEPTIVDNIAMNSLLNTEETFGPVASFASFSNEQEAIKMANNNMYGLSASIFTNDISRAFAWADCLNVSLVNINEQSAYWESHTPVGGMSGSMSGIGRTGGRHTILEMSDLKTIVVERGDNHLR